MEKAIVIWYIGLMRPLFNRRPGLQKYSLILEAHNTQKIIKILDLLMTIICIIEIGSKVEMKVLAQQAEQGTCWTYRPTTALSYRSTVV